LTASILFITEEIEMSRISTVILLALSTGCLTASGETGAPTETTDLTAVMVEIEALKVRLNDAEGTIAELQTENASLQAALDALPADVASVTYVDAADADLQAQVDGIDGFSEADLATYLVANGYLNALPADLVTTKALTKALGGYVTYGDLAGYATIDDVFTEAEVAAYLLANGYLNSLPPDLVHTGDLAGYATTAYVDAEVAAVPSYDDADVAAYLAANDYATEAWVTGRSYATTSYVDGEIGALDLYGDADVAAYLAAGDFATEAWVLSQGYATVAAMNAADAGLSDGIDGLAAAAITALTEDLVIAVPGDQPDLYAALASLDTVSIPGDVMVTIEVAPGWYAMPEPLVLSHADGDRIVITGDNANPASTVLDFYNGTSGVVASDGHVLHTLEGVHIMGSLAEGTVGVHALRGGRVSLGGGVEVSNFGDGVVAEWGGQVFASGTSSIDNLGSGYLAWVGGLVEANDAIADGNASMGFRAAYVSYVAATNSVATANGHGFEAGGTASINAEGSSASENAYNGYNASSLGVMNAGLSDANNNGANGYSAHASGFVIAAGGRSTNNGQYGVWAGNRSEVDVHAGFFVSGNAAGDADPAITATADSGTNQDALVYGQQLDAPY
jgi:hypothetical protein